MSTATQPTNFEVGVDVVAGHELGAQRGLAHLARPQQQHPANIGQLGLILLCVSASLGYLIKLMEWMGLGSKRNWQLLHKNILAEIPEQQEQDFNFRYEVTALYSSSFSSSQLQSCMQKRSHLTMLTVLPCSASWSALTQPLDLTLDLLLHDCRLLEYTDPLKHYALLFIENIVSTF